MKYFFILIGVFCGIILSTTIYVSAQTKVIPNSLFNSITEKEKIEGITQEQKDFSILYGRLDMISLQIKNLEDRKCQ